jgi:hypothetical protein
MEKDGTRFSSSEVRAISKHSFAHRRYTSAVAMQEAPFRVATQQTQSWFRSRAYESMRYAVPARQINQTNIR